MKNKSAKRIFTLLLAVVMVLGCSAVVWAALDVGNPTVTFNGEEIKFREGTEYPTDLFDNFKGVMPGDVLYEQVTVRNDSDKAIKVYLKANAHGEDNAISAADKEKKVLAKLTADERREQTAELDYMNDFLSQLTMKVWNGDDSGTLIYETSPDQTAGLTDYVELGKLAKKESQNLTIELAVPHELDNDYADRIGEVDWVFSVTEVSGGNPPGGGGGGGGTPEFTDDHVAYIIGYPDGNVHPEANITRAEVVTILFRLLADESRAEYWSQTNEFTDVISTNWFNNAVSTLTNAGIINGYEDGTFRPNEPITRAEFAALVARFSEAAQQMTTDFVDVTKEHWAFAEIAKAESLGWIKGYPDSTFKPNQNITRAEAMTLTNRVLERAVETEYLLKDMVKWPDNADTKAWYYIDVQEATNSHDYDRLTKKVEGLGFAYEKWLKLKPVPDWQSLENTWSTAYVQK